MENITINISSSVVQVGSSAYRTDKIDFVRSVKVSTSALNLMMAGRTYAILIRFDGSSIVLVKSKDQTAINVIAQKITEAMSEHTKGNKTYFSSVNINGDMVNQSGNFGTGFNTGEIRF